MNNRDLKAVPLARRSIGYLTEDCGAAGASCRRQVRRALVKRLISKQGKGERFLSIFGNAETRREQDFDAGKRSGELSENQRIVRATAGHNELVNFRLGQHEAAQGMDDRERGEDCSRADELVRPGAMVAAEGDEHVRVGLAGV